MVKNSLLFLFFFVFLFGSQDWVVKLDNHVWYESDFYRFFPESDWKKVSDNNKKTKIVTGFLKQNVAAQKALSLGLFDFFERCLPRFRELLELSLTH